MDREADSILVVAGNHKQREHYNSGLRAEGLRPVTVTSVDGAIALLRQFGVGAVVFYLAWQNAAAWQDCARLIATGAPVVLFTADLRADVLRRYLTSGCAACVGDGSPISTLASVVERVIGGERWIVHLETLATDIR